MRKNKLLGIGIGLFGALLISLLPVLEKGSQINGDILGNLFIFFAMVFWAIYTIGSQHAIRRGYSPITITSMSLFVSAFIFCIITLLTYHGNLLISFSRPDTLLLLLHLSLLVTVATYLLYQWAIKHSSGTTASLNIYLQPVFGLGINALLLGERVTTGLLIGSTFVILGVVLATKRK
jgi:drug/metabolite transporter (DMT)-like permease